MCVLLPSTSLSLHSAIFPRRMSSSETNILKINLIYVLVSFVGNLNVFVFRKNVRVHACTSKR
jgi:hypothetical protein